MSKYALLILFFLISSGAIGQISYLEDSTKKANDYAEAYAPIPNNTVPAQVRDMMQANREIQYLSPFPIFNPLNQAVLRPEEGKNGFALEGHLAPNFTIMRGRKDSRYWKRLTQLTLDPAFTFRLALTESIPLVPVSTKLGATVERGFILSKSHRSPRKTYIEDGIEKSKIDKNVVLMHYDKLSNKLFSSENLNVLITSLTFMHYSNGQKAGALYYPDANDSSVFRNDYSTGNFSTYYLRFQGAYTVINRQRTITTLGLAYRRDLNIDFEETQNFRYGKDRIQSLIQIKSGPQKHIFRKNYNRFVYDYQKIANNDSIPYSQKKSVPALAEYYIRLESELIIGNLSEFSEYPFNIKLQAGMNPLKSRTMGYFVQLYYGRDYLNIRYDLPVFSAMIGLTFTFNKSYLDKEYAARGLRDVYNYELYEELRKKKELKKENKRKKAR